MRQSNVKAATALILSLGLTSAGSTQTINDGFAAAKSKDLPKAARIFRVVCDRGEAIGCLHLGILTENGWGVPKNQTKASELYRRGCEGGDATSCWNIANNYSEGRGVAKSMPQANNFWGKACDGGFAKACGNLGNNYLDGVGVDKDRSQAAKYLQKACDADLAPSCVNLGRLYTNGAGVAQDTTLGATLYKKGCDAGFALGCTFLGFDYANGRGVPKDVLRGLDLYRKGCDGGDASGCRYLGVHYGEGVGVPKDASKALTFYQKALALTTDDAARQRLQQSIAALRTSVSPDANVYVHHATGFKFPPILGQFMRTQIKTYNPEATDVSASYSLSSNGKQIVATVYIYPAPPADTDTAKKTNCAEEFRSIKAAIEKSKTGARKLVETMVSSPVPGRIQTGSKAVYAYEGNLAGVVQPLRSEADLFCYVSGPWFISYRATAAEKLPYEPDLAALMRALSWPS